MTLKEKREARGYTQNELAAASGVKLRTIQQYECGQRDINGARLDTLCTLAIALNCKVYEIIDNEQLKTKLKMTI